MSPGPEVSPLDFSDLRHYDWLNVPAWVLDTDSARMPWANAAGLAFWGAASIEELRAQRAPSMDGPAREPGAAADLSPPVQGMNALTWASRPIRMPDKRLAWLYVGEALAGGLDAQALRGIEAMQHTTVRIMLYRLDRAGVLMRNPAAGAAFGPVGDDKNRDKLEALFAEPALAKRIKAQAKRGQTFAAEAELLTLQGRRWHALDARPVRDPVSGQTVLQINARDITELKVTQQALEGARDAAEAASRAKSAFLANMSHEIRTPMNGVLGLTGLVLDSELDAKQREYLALALASAKSLMALINDVLDLSRLEARTLTLQAQPFALRDLLDEALTPHCIEAQAKSLTFDWNVDENVPELLLGDAARLRQIVVNLVGNGVKFTERGTVSLSVMRDAPSGTDARGLRLRLRVGDTGIGMTAQELSHAFEPFAQADSGHSRRHGGAGLGLSIVQRLARMMGGDVHATSTPGQGSVFEVTLTLAAVD